MAEAESKDPVYSLLASATDAAPAPGVVKRALQAIRSHLGMDVAYVSEFVGDRSVFREVDAPGHEALIKAGDSFSLDDIYCRHILEGRMPQLIPDTSVEPIAAALPITKAVPVGKHISVPIRLPDGRAYGMFCCLGFAPDQSLRERDLKMMQAFADLAAFEINRDLATAKLAEDKKVRIRNVLEQDQISIAYQPIWKLEPRRIVGLECLSRFSATPQRSPDEWFAEAAEVGLGVALELTAIRLALSALSAFPADVYLTINASPATILSRELPATLDGMPPERLVLEVTEYALVDDYDRLLTALQPLRTRGVRLAVDDAGAGYSSLRHILHLQPDFIKLDMSLTRHIDLDPARRALASALIGFARETNSRIIAEGVETASELAALRSLGVEKAQGYFLNRPMSLSSALTLFNPQAKQTSRVA
jgi:EAL domain-containing protein (putative c-di-GMP-specific phosphodiesterase class I)